jgi:hypothetical protein
MAKAAGPPAWERIAERSLAKMSLARPSLHFRLRAWREFQRALDPFAPPKPLKRPQR